MLFPFINRFVGATSLDHNHLTSAEMAQLMWRPFERTGDGFFNKIGATWTKKEKIKLGQPG